MKTKHIQLYYENKLIKEAKKKKRRKKKKKRNRESKFKNRHFKSTVVK